MLANDANWLFLYIPCHDRNKIVFHHTLVSEIYDVRLVVGNLRNVVDVIVDVIWPLALESISLKYANL